MKNITWRVLRKARAWLFPKNTYISKDINIEEISMPGYKHSFFGYYDRSPLSDDGNTILFCATNENDYTLGDEKLDICLYELNEKRYRRIASSSGWSFQQASQQQWLSKDEIVFNDIVVGKRRCNVVSKVGELIREFDFHIGLVDKKHRRAVSFDYNALFEREVEYGYSGLEKPSLDLKLQIRSLDDGNIICELDRALLLSAHPSKSRYQDCEVWLQHPKFSPNGEKILFVIRSQKNNSKVESDLYIYDMITGQITCALEWSDWKRGGHHPVWLDNTDILMNVRNRVGEPLSMVRFSCYRDNYHIISSGIIGTGHPTLSLNGEYIITDDYPDYDRLQTMKLVTVDGGEYILASMWPPKTFSGRLGCDLHPRWIADKKISFDSTLSGERKLYLADLSGVMLSAN
jgi:hypothetical protein